MGKGNKPHMEDRCFTAIRSMINDLRADFGRADGENRALRKALRAERKWHSATIAHLEQREAYISKLEEVNSKLTDEFIKNAPGLLP